MFSIKWVSLNKFKITLTTKNLFFFLFFCRKTPESPTRHRHRSHTISKLIGEQATQPHLSIVNDPNLKNSAINNHHSKINRCGYDSFLHATICSNNVTTTTTNQSPLLVNTPNKILQNYNNRSSRTRHKSNDIPVTASPQLQGYTKLNSSHCSKLNTTILGQLNPHLTAEQKFSRTINHVEKWLNERDQQQVLNNKTNNDLKILKFGGDSNNDSKNKNKDILKEDKNIDNLMSANLFVDKLKLTEKFTEKLTESPKKTFNKEVLLARKTTSTTTPATSSKEQSQQQQPPQRSSSTSNNNPNLVDSIKAKGPIMEYATIPITVDSSECENLLRASSDESCQSPDSNSTVHRYVHEHIHHHYHHFENAEELL